MATKTNWSDMERWIEEQIQRLHQHTRFCEEVRQMSEDLPKQDLLVKLLKMTTSQNDGECIVAIRKANALLASAGWDWDRLIAGKIKVVEDPFKSVMDPFSYNHTPRAKPEPPAPPRQPSQPRQPTRPVYGSGGPFSAQQPGAGTPPPPPPPPRQRPRGNPIASTKENIYAGWCYCCGDAVLGKQGFIFDPNTRNKSAKSKWQIICKQCNVHDFPSIGPSAYPRQRPLGNVTPSLNDI